MSKVAIAIDMDDVLAAHVPSFIEFSNQKYGTKLTPEDYSDHWADLWQVNDEEIERRAKEFHIPERVLAYEFMKESDDILRSLAKGYILYIVTARGKNMIDVTYQWLDKHLPGVFSGVHFVPIWEPNNTITKADICNEIGADYLIDDLPRHCNIAAKAGITALLFGDYNWNRHEQLEPGVVTVKDWSAVGAFFDGRR